MAETGGGDLPGPADDGVAQQGSWLWAHIGRLSGIALGIVALAALVFLAIAGFAPALGLLVVLVVGVAFVIIGGRIRGS